MAALASSVVESTPMVLPRINPPCASRSSTQVKILWCVSALISRRVREIVTWSGVVSSSPIDRNCRSVSESATRHAMPRSLSIPSKKPTIMMRKYNPGGNDGRPSLA